MLPFPLLDIDVTARAAVYEGYNDNVVEMRPAPDAPSERRGSPFTGVDVGIETGEGGRSNSWSVRAGARGQHYTPIGGRLVGGDDGALMLGWNANLQLDKKTTLSLGQFAMLAGQNTARLADMPLLMLDPSMGRQTFVMANNNVSCHHELTGAERLRVTLSGLVRYLVRDSAPVGPGEGVDYAGPQLESEWIRDLGSADSGILRLNIGGFYTPRALLDLSGRRGPSKTWQATPTAIWVHHLNESWQSEIRGGVSFVTTTSETFSTLNVMPAIATQMTYTEDQQFFQLNYSLGINTVNIALGPGLGHSLGAVFGGPVSKTHLGRRFVAGLTTSLSQGSVPSSESTSFVVGTAGAGGLLSYALRDWMGIVVGYEGQYMNMGQTGGAPAPSVSFYRNVVYVGLSGIVSSTPGALPVDVPRPPPR